MHARLRPQSAFPRHDSLDALLASDVDGLHVLGHAAPVQGRFLQDFGKSPYLLRLLDPLLIPPGGLRPRLSQLARLALRHRVRAASGAALPPGLHHAASGLLLTGDGHLIADSFGGSVLVPPGCTPAPSWDDPWEVRARGPEQRLAGCFVYLELLPAHFGHALVDMPARLWPLARPRLATALSGARFLAYGSHGAGPDPAGWPDATRRLLAACGVDPERVTVVDRPTRVEELIVPRAIGPQRGVAGPRYNEVMARAGRALEAEAGPAAGDPPPRLFLSRSRLRAGGRSLDAATGARLDALFARHGFAVIHPQEIDLAQQAALVRGATHLAGVTGSQLHLAALSERRGLRMLRLCPSFFVNGTDRSILAPLGGEVEDWVVPARLRLGQVAHRAPWRLGAADLARLDATLETWAGG